jgi:nitrate/nitrite transporter NarK
MIPRFIFLRFQGRVYASLNGHISFLLFLISFVRWVLLAALSVACMLARKAMGVFYGKVLE